MARFLIYVPQTKAANCRLDWLGACDSYPTQHGPDGGPGLVWCRFDPARLDSNPRSNFYDATTQRWQRIATADYWLGVDTASPVEPADIERPELLPSAEVVLADGAAWRIPIAQALPHVMQMDTDRRWRRKPQAPHETYVDRARWLFHVFMEQVAAELAETEATQPERTLRLSLDHDIAIAHALEALALNYTLVPEIVSALGLLSDESVVRICQASVDLPLIGRVLEKKNAAPALNRAGSTTSPGAPA